MLPIKDRAAVIRVLSEVVTHGEVIVDKHSLLWWLGYRRDTWEAWRDLLLIWQAMGGDPDVLQGFTLDGSRKLLLTDRKLGTSLVKAWGGVRLTEAALQAARVAQAEREAARLEAEAAAADA
jgi:hypothetical protein